MLNDQLPEVEELSECDNCKDDENSCATSHSSFENSSSLETSYEESSEDSDQSEISYHPVARTSIFERMKQAVRRNNIQSTDINKL